MHRARLTRPGGVRAHIGLVVMLGLLLAAALAWLFASFTAPPF